LGKVGAAASLVFFTSGRFDEISLCARDEDKSWAEALDLTHASSLIIHNCVVNSKSIGELADCEIIVITVGVPQSAIGNNERSKGMLAAADMIEGVMRGIADKNPDAVIIILTNPVEPMVWKALQVSKFHPRQIISTGTVLDSARLQNSISNLLSVDAKDVHALILGEHGVTAFPLLSTASVGGVPMKDLIDEEEEMCVKAAILDVLKEPFLVKEYKGGTSSAVAMAALKVAEAVITDANALLTVSAVPVGIPGVEDICINLPAVVGKGGVKRIFMPQMDEQEQLSFKKSVDKIRAGIDQLR